MNPETPSDEELVNLSRRRGPAGRRAFGELAARHEAWLLRLLVHVLGSQADAEDVAQDVFVRASRRLESLRDPSQVRAWLRVMALRLAFNAARSRKLRTLREGEVEPLHRSPRGERLMKRELILRTLDRLSYLYREILLLRFVEELSVEEIAAALDIGESAAKMRLSRARTAFMAAWEDLTSEAAPAKGREDE